MYIRKLFILLSLSALLLAGCGSKGENLSGLDKEFERVSRKAAETVLKNEADDYTWTSVETGELEYKYTVYNEAKDVYKAFYLAKFDAEDEPEDEWLGISVIITSKTKSVKDTECCYYNATTYEGFRIPASIEDAEGIWVNVNKKE